MSNQLLNWNGLPRCLRKPLKFGDVQQIEALKALEAKAEEQAQLEEALEAGEISEYWVTVSWSAETSLRVLAENKYEAEKIAREDPPEPDEMEIEYIHAKPIKKGEAPMQRGFSELPLFTQQ